MRLINLANYNDQIDEINEALANGANEKTAKVAAMMAAENFLKNDANLKDRIDSLDK